MCLPNNTCAMGAQPMGAPGCPDLAACTISADRHRTVLMQRVSMLVFCFLRAAIVKNGRLWVSG